MNGLKFGKANAVHIEAAIFDTVSVYHFHPMFLDDKMRSTFLFEESLMDEISAYSKRHNSRT